MNAIKVIHRYGEIRIYFLYFFQEFSSKYGVYLVMNILSFDKSWLKMEGFLNI